VCERDGVACWNIECVSKGFKGLDTADTPCVALPRTCLLYNLIKVSRPRKVDVRLHGKGNSNSQGARPVHLIITMIKWIRTIRLSLQNSLASAGASEDAAHLCSSLGRWDRGNTSIFNTKHRSRYVESGMCYLSIDAVISQHKTQP